MYSYYQMEYTNHFPFLMLIFFTKMKNRFTSYNTYSNYNVAVSCRVCLVCLWNQPFKIGVIPFIYVFQKVNCFLLKWYFVQHFPSGFRLTWEHSQCWINCQLMVDGFSFYVFTSYRNIWHIFQVEFIYQNLKPCAYFEHMDMVLRYTDFRYFATYKVVHGCGKTFVS